MKFCPSSPLTYTLLLHKDSSIYFVTASEGPYEIYKVPNSLLKNLTNQLDALEVLCRSWCGVLNICSSFHPLLSYISLDIRFGYLVIPYLNVAGLFWVVYLPRLWSLPFISISRPFLVAFFL